MKKIAFILSGCGGLDGTEVHEALYSFLAVKQLGCNYECFSINKSQYRVNNFLTGEVIENETRNIMQESARLVRNKAIKEIAELRVDDFDILFFPGGVGSALNISTFFTKENINEDENYTVDESIKKIIKEFYEQKKPICALCIAPMILAKSLNKITITIGNNKKIAKIIEKTGNFHKDTESGNICIDEKNKIITSPCFMLANNIEIIYNEAYKVVKKAIEL